MTILSIHWQQITSKTEHNVFKSVWFYTFKKNAIVFQNFQHLPQVHTITLVEKDQFVTFHTYHTPRIEIHFSSPRTGYFHENASFLPGKLQ